MNPNEPSPNGYLPPAFGDVRLSWRFWNKVRIEGECWIWSAWTDRSGSPRFWFNGAERQAHRVAFEQLLEPLKRKGTIHRTVCQRLTCVNPAHMELR